MEAMDSYYQGIMQKVESEVNEINRVFNHQGVKGTGNENILFDLLEKFLPKKYGIGTGIVIDNKANQSKQCDIIIYDAINYPEIFAITNAKFFPVDFVYATIEVKTTLDGSKVKEAIQNIRSVQSLEYVREEFRHPSTAPVKELNKDTVLWLNTSTSPPLGLVFGYASKTKTFETFVDWFEPSKDKLGPTHVFSLDQGFLVDHPDELIKKLLPYINNACYQNDDNINIQNKHGKDWGEVDGRMMPFSKIAGENVAIDQSKVLLHFLVMVSELLKSKLLSPNISIYENYISERNRTMFTIENGKLIADVL